MLLLRRIAFDFDGVLALTNQGKAVIFADAMNIAGSSRGAFVERFIETGGMGRHQKIMLLWQEFHGTPLAPEEATRIGNELSSRAASMVVATGLVPGMAESIERLRSRGLALSVVSGTPQGELERYLSLLKVRPLFEWALGSPAKKRDHLLTISCGARARTDSLYIGDTLEDAQAADEAGWSFVKVGSVSMHERAEREPIAMRSCIAQLAHAAELPRWLDSLGAPP